MSPPGSISHLIDQTKNGDTAAMNKLNERYFEPLVELVRRRLRNEPAGKAGPEDVVNQVLCTFFEEASRGKFADLLNRDDLWKLLYVRIMRKAANVVRDERRARRGGGRALSPEAGSRVLVQTPGNEPNPARAAIAKEEFLSLLAMLQKDDLQAVARLKAQGCTEAQIAAELGIALRSVQRKLRLIRDQHAQETAS